MAVESIDWSLRDVMVGVLHNAKQLEANLTHRFYHMPAKLLAVSPVGVKAVAIYQSQAIFGKSGAGVRQWGRVVGYKRLPRGEIREIPRTRNPDEEYFRFAIDGWQQLTRPIRARGLAPGVSMFTSEFLIKNSRFFPELYIRTAREWELYSLLRAAAVRTRESGGTRQLPAKNKNTVMITGDDIGVYTADGRYDQYNLRDFYYQPYSFLQKMGEAMGW